VISLVLPAHNEAGWLAATIDTVLSALTHRGRDFEVVVVENGSTDGTAELAAKLANEQAPVRTLSLPEANYGRALRDGLLASRGDVAVIFDVDFVDFAFLDAAVARLEAPNGPALVVGSKRGPGARDERPWHRRFVTATFSVVLRAGFGLSVPDTHGIKALRLDVLRPVVEQCELGTDLFDTELVLRAERAGHAVEAIPVSVRETRPSRTPITRRAARSIVGLLQLRRALGRRPARRPPEDRP
jgi:glycosyltransferase AglD